MEQLSKGTWGSMWAAHGGSAGTGSSSQPEVDEESSCERNLAWAFCFLQNPFETGQGTCPYALRGTEGQVLCPNHLTFSIFIFNSLN